jgi:hypothetical protein
MHPIFLAAGFAFMFFAPCVLAIRTDVNGDRNP